MARVKGSKSPVEYRQLRRERNYEFVNSYKLSVGCEGLDCKWEGNFTPQQLHFDHLVPADKEHSVSFLCKNGNSLKQIKKEITKCQVLCANCHAEKTYEEGEYYGSK